MSPTPHSQLIVRLDPELHRQLKVHAALTGETMNATVVRLLETFLATAGHQAMVEAASNEGLGRHELALDKLADL